MMTNHDSSIATTSVLNIACWHPCSTANGPGKRFVLWLQGCLQRCPGCINAELQPIEPRNILTIAEVIKLIFESSASVEGVTFTGGEPMLQASALSILAREVKQHGLSVLAYSGYTFESLQSDSHCGALDLIAQLDILIDGPFVESLAAPLRWRGSRNQRIVWLTERYREYANGADDGTTAMELSLDAEGLSATGFWPPGFLERLHEKLKDRPNP